METVRVELPSALLKAANLEEANISQEAARNLHDRTGHRGQNPLQYIEALKSQNINEK
jgi:hypothetical protein